MKRTMDKEDLLSSGSGERVQAFPLSKGNVNLTSADGAQTRVTLIHCVADGSVTITWTASGTSAIAMTAGGDFAVNGLASVVITAGTFHFA